MDRFSGSRGATLTDFDTLLHTTFARQNKREKPTYLINIMKHDTRMPVRLYMVIFCIYLKLLS